MDNLDRFYAQLYRTRMAALNLNYEREVSRIGSKDWNPSPTQTGCNQVACLCRNGDAKLAFSEAFIKAHEENPHKVTDLWKSADSLLQAINDSSTTDILYDIRPSKKNGLMNCFFSCILPELCRCFRQYFIEHLDHDYIDPEGRFDIRSSSYKYGDLAQDQETLQIGMVDIVKLTLTWYCVPDSIRLKKFLKDYANAIGASTNALHFELNGSKLFLSDLGKKNAHDCRMEDGCLILVTRKPRIVVNERVPLQPLYAGNKLKSNRPRRAKKAKAKSKRTRQKAIQPTKTEKQLEEENFKQNLRLWMDAITRVHLEAEPLFKKKREKLNAIYLERTAPKEREIASKSAPESLLIDNFPTGGPGGKAGKSHFLIRVGEVNNLYMTSKTRSSFSPQRALGGKHITTLDLHGYTKVEAWEKLEECLQKWIATAMEGNYPWVISVKIICGGGSQLLSEVVETWIKQNKEVSNAPKSIYY